MAEIFVEQRGHQYVALRDKVIVSTGTTEADTAHRAHHLYPSDVVFGVGIRTRTVGSPDERRRIF